MRDFPMASLVFERSFLRLYRCCPVVCGHDGRHDCVSDDRFALKFVAKN